MSNQAPTEAAASVKPHWSDGQREIDFDAWLHTVADSHALAAASLRTVCADASFRRYFRIDSGTGSCIIMDAPPTQEDCRAFVKVAHLMAQSGLNVPQILAWDENHGFMLLSDLGNQTMLQVMNTSSAVANRDLYLQAVDVLLRWQLASRAGVLPAYDAALLRRELDLFPHWYLSQHRGLALSTEENQTLEQSFAKIINDNLAWPSVYVHRDFMPRNLMLPATAAGLGVLDFQDAVHGPITYDIASLMRDAFLSWDEEFVLDITVCYWEQARRLGLPVGTDFGAFYRAVEWMGLQRHLKVAGIFARLTLRDGKPQYLADTPRFIGYIRATCKRYRELKALLRLVEKVEGIEVGSGFAFGRG